MAFLTKRSLSLGNVPARSGVTLALPFLDSMLPAVRCRSDGGAAGRHALARSLPARRDHAEVDAGDRGCRISDLRNPAAAESVPEPHQRHQRSGVRAGVWQRRRRITIARPPPYLSGAFAKTGARPELGVTIDQVIARKIGQDTPLPSLELMIEEASVNCGDGLNCAYRDTISWQGPIPRCRWRTTRR